MLTCKQFLRDLNEFIDDELDPQVKAELKKHVSECPNCWVVYDTTEKTIRVYKGMEAQPLPETVSNRLNAFLRQHCPKAKKAEDAPVAAESRDTAL